MVQLHKSEKPKVLIENQQAWTEELLEFVRAKTAIPKAVQSKYRNVDIKAAVLMETKDKCAYCESKILHVHHAEIEHIKPKSKFPEKCFDWENLTVACSICNNKKSDYYDENIPLINPYTDNPGDHIDCEGPLIFSLDTSTSGKKTVLTLDLNRSALLLSRCERLKPLLNLIARYNAEPDVIKKEIFKSELIAESNSDREYSFIVKRLLESRQIF